MGLIITNPELKRKGHYARIKHTAHFDRLLRAKDKTKDQSYYLSSLTRDQLKHVNISSVEGLRHAAMSQEAGGCSSHTDTLGGPTSGKYHERLG